MLKGLHSFKKDTKLKQSIERGLYTKARYNYGITSNILMVAGPDLLRHLKTARETVACFSYSQITVVDIDINVHYEQRAKLDSYNHPQRRIPTWTSFDNINGMFEPGHLLPIIHNTHLVFGNIEDQPPSRFIDADLMATIKNAGPTIVKTLRKQRNAFPLGTQTKGFIFTVSLRGGGGIDKNLDWVEHELLPNTGTTAKLDRTKARSLVQDQKVRRSSNGFKGVFFKEPAIVLPKDTSILHDVTLRTYNDDGGPMLTGLLLYS